MLDGSISLLLVVALHIGNWSIACSLFVIINDVCYNKFFSSFMKKKMWSHGNRGTQGTHGNRGRHGPWKGTNKNTKKTNIIIQIPKQNS